MSTYYYHTTSHHQLDSYEPNPSNSYELHLSYLTDPPRLSPDEPPYMTYHQQVFYQQMELDTDHLHCPWVYEIDADEVSDWLQYIEVYFDARGYDDPTRCAVTVASLLGQAGEWWDTLEWHRIREGRPCIQSWRKMKLLLIERFDPVRYKQIRKCKIAILRAIRARAATTIQAYTRGMIVRRDIMRMKQSISILQHNLRSTLLRRARHGSTIHIQEAQFRGPIQRQLFLRRSFTPQMIIDTCLDLLQRYGRPLLIKFWGVTLPTFEDAPMGEDTYILEQLAHAEFKNDRLQIYMIEWNLGEAEQAIHDPLQVELDPIFDDLMLPIWDANDCDIHIYDLVFHLCQHFDMVINLDLESTARYITYKVTDGVRLRPPKEPPNDDSYQITETCLMGEDWIRQRPPIEPLVEAVREDQHLRLKSGAG